MTAHAPNSPVTRAFVADVVHLGHMYADSDAPDRDARVTHAATTMGVTVVAGAATTMGAGAVMLLCQMTFFTKVGFLVAVAACPLCACLTRVLCVLRGCAFRWRG